MKRSVLGLLAVALWTTRSVVTGVTEKAESCDLTHGEWLHDASVAKRIARSVSDRPAEKMSNYDCSSYLQSMRLPNIDHYTHTLPFCERVPDEKLQKLVQKNNPNLVLFVGEALTGNDSVDQVLTFEKYCGRIDGLLVSKLDTVDEKIGTLLNLCYSVRRPIVFVGTGQKYPNLKRLQVEEVCNLLLG